LACETRLCSPVNYVSLDGLATQASGTAGFLESPLSINKLQELLNSVPYINHLGLQVCEASPGGVTLALTEGHALQDFAGNVHSAAVFALGEAAAGVAVSTHPQLVGFNPMQQASGIKYLQPVQSRPYATAELDADVIKLTAATLQTEGRAKLEVVVPVHDNQGSVFAEVVSVFSLRQPTG
jgi:acyl-coenzyme A thioesterase PaaI-like protein